METISRKAGDKTGDSVNESLPTLDYALLSKLVLRDLNRFSLGSGTSWYSKVTRDDIRKWLAAPKTYEKELREAVQYIYGASGHFRRLIQYFVGLTDLAYIVQPYKIDPRKQNAKTLNLNYRKVLNMLSSMNIKTQLPKILTVCLREDVFYGTLWVTPDSVTIQQLPSDYCAISSVEGNVPNVTFNFSFFDTRKELLDFYPPEFTAKYRIYREKTSMKWIELDSPNSFAVKCNSDILEYAIPPFVGILRELYDIENYKDMKLAKEAIENYALLVMRLPVDDDGNWKTHFEEYREFWRNLNDVVPEEIGTILSPMDVNKIGFEKSNVGDADTVAEAEQHMFSEAGVSSLLFNNEKASANALLLSIKSDQSLTYGIVKNIADALNRFIQAQSYGKNFIVNFLDVSPYNRKEFGDAMLKAASYGLPTISAYAASQGIGQAELDGMSFLEGTVLDLPSMFKPIQSSTQMGDLSKTDSEGQAGAPQKEIGELSDSRESNSERE